MYVCMHVCMHGMHIEVRGRGCVFYHEDLRDGILVMWLGLKCFYLLLSHQTLISLVDLL